MNQVDVRTLRVLVFGRPQCGDELEQWIADHARVTRASTADDALTALRDEAFDFVISSSPAFASLAQSHLTGHAATALDTCDQGVCILSPAGELVWANPKMLSFSSDVQDRVRKCGLETFEWARSEMQDEAFRLTGRRFSITTPSDEHYEITATPVIDLEHNVTQVAVVVLDTTRLRRLQSKLDAIERAGQELVRLDTDQIARLDVQERLALMEQKVIRCVKDVLHFDNFAIRVLDKRTNRLDLVLSQGISPEAQRLDLFATPEGNGICGYVAAVGRSYICPEVTTDPRYLVGITNARSSLTVPLWLYDQVVGVANFESTRANAFNEDSRQFAEIFCRYVAQGLHLFQLLVTERTTTTGQIGSNVLAEITGPLNDISTEVKSLLDADPQDEALRCGLTAIAENAVRIRESIKELVAGKVIGARGAKARRDPTLDGKVVLVADDEDVIRDTIRDVLKGYGCEVCSACDGQQAIDLIAARPFDLILSDIKLPARNGYEIFAAAKERDAALPVILMTGFGYDPNHSIVRARREGLTAVLFKPFKIDQLVSEIRTAFKPASAC